MNERNEKIEGTNKIESFVCDSFTHEKSLSQWKPVGQIWSSFHGNKKRELQFPQFLKAS